MGKIRAAQGNRSYMWQNTDVGQPKGSNQQMEDKSPPAIYRGEQREKAWRTGE